MKKYFYLDGDQKLGPFSILELNKKQITENTLIWFEGLDHWKFAKEFDEIDVTTKPNNFGFKEMRQLLVILIKMAITVLVIIAIAFLQIEINYILLMVIGASVIISVWKYNPDKKKKIDSAKNESDFRQEDNEPENDNLS